MAKTLHTHTFNLLSQFRDALDLAISTIEPSVKSQIESIVTYDDIRASLLIEANDVDSNKHSGLYDHLGNLSLQIIYSHVLQRAPLEPYYSLKFPC